MNYNKVVPANFIERKNRFVARVSLTNQEDRSSLLHFTNDIHGECKPNDIHGECKPEDRVTYESDDMQNTTEVYVHVKNTGRCRELLVPGATVYLDDHAEDMGTRKYRYDLIAVEKVTPDRTILINMDSQAPNKVVGEALKSGSLCLIEADDDAPESERSQQVVYDIIRPETTFGSSRFDFYIETSYESVGGKYRESLYSSADSNHPESSLSSVDITPRRAFIEVKGVTLEEDGIARFPDAPTERGVKHIKELERALAEGYDAYIIFVIQMKGVILFEPNDVTHPEFGEALRHADNAGVKIFAYDCNVEPDRLEINQSIQIKL